MDEHDWPAVLSAIECLLKTSQEDEPNAVNFHAAIQKVLFHAAIQKVLDGMPDEAFQ